MSDERKLQSKEGTNVFLDNLSVLATPDGFQKYVLGTKKNGDPRAIYDVVKDCSKPKKKKKKKNKDKSKSSNSTYAFYIDSKKGKKKKKKNKNKHWHI